MNRHFLLKSGLIMSFLCLSMHSCIFEKSAKQDYQFHEQEAFPVEVVQNDEFLYGINVTGKPLVNAVVERNQNLAGILLSYGAGTQKLNELLLALRTVFDPRKIVAGKPITVVSHPEHCELTHFIYEHTPAEFLVIDFERDTVWKGRKEVGLHQKTVSGVITSSLYQTLEEQGVPTSLAVELADIYAWSLDFYRIQKYDSFRVVYTEKWIEGQSHGIEAVQAASFTHKGETFYAFRYDQEGTSEYFDENGKSLRKAFLQAPIKFSRISSKYSKKRFHPVLKVNKPHLGTDYAAPSGTPIMSVADGTVLEATFSKNNGYFVKIKHNETYTTQYLHMSKFVSGIRKGGRVKQGQVIGYVGSTGLATGPHLCYRFWKNGVQVDPYKEKMPPSYPVSNSCALHYQQFVVEMKSVLN